MQLFWLTVAAVAAVTAFRTLARGMGGGRATARELSPREIAYLGSGRTRPGAAVVVRLVASGALRAVTVLVTM